MRVVGEPTGHPHPPSHEFKLLYFKYIVKIPKIGLEIHHLSWFWENNPFELSGKKILYSNNFFNAESTTS